MRRSVAKGKNLVHRDFDHITLVESKIRSLHNAYLQTRGYPLQYRIEQINVLKDYLNKKKALLAEAIHLNMGKTLDESRGEIDKAIYHCNYYAKNAEDFLRPQLDQFGSHKFKSTMQPTGVVFKITPLNFPVWIGFKTLIPNIVLGNTFLLRPSMKCFDVDSILEEIIKESALDCFDIGYTSIQDTEAILSNKLISGVSFTGSTAAGRVIGEMAGKHLKKCILELGGSDAFVVTENTVNEKVVADAIKGGLKS